MSTLANTFEGTASGLDVSAANSANGGNAFDAVTAGTGATRVYDNAQYVHGSQSARFATGGTSATSYLQWDQGSIGDATEIFERWYMRLDSIPASAKYIREWRDKDASVTVARLQVNATGTLTLTDTSAGVVIGPTSTALAADTWYRIEVRILAHPSAGTAELRIYSAVDSTTITETQSTTGESFGSTIVNRSRNGWVATASNLPSLWLDDWAISTSDWIGPAITHVASGDSASGDDSGTVTVTGFVAKSGTDTASASDVGSVIQPATDDYRLAFGATALYSAEALTEADSFARFYDELGHDLDFYRATVNGVPRTYNQSPLTVATFFGLDALLGIRTDWVTGARSADDWADDLTALLVDIELNAPGMHVAFVLNPEPEFRTTRLPFIDEEGPEAENALLEAIEQAARYREHALALARAIWAYGNPAFSVCLAFSGYNSLRYVSSGDRLLNLQTLEFVEFGLIDWTNEERIKVTVLASIYPKLNASGDVSSDYEDVDQRLLDDFTGGGTITNQLPFWEYAEQGYVKFGISDFAYNADACPTLHTKIRDAWRGHTSTPTTIAGSIGAFLDSTVWRVEYFSARERSYFGAPEPGGPGISGTLANSSTRMDGYFDLLDALRVTDTASGDTGQATDVAVVDITGTHEVAVDDAATFNDWAAYSDA